MAVELLDLGFMGYHQAHELQLEYVAKQLSDETGSEVVLITEHPPVFTLGRKGSLASLIRSKEDILAEGIDIIHTERGGDITYHGPGQLVVYPIINLRRRKISVTDFILMLEDIMLRTSRDLGVSAARDTRNRGIWVGDNKIGSVGIRVRHGVTFHGLALNVNLSLDPFQWIEPCGLKGVGVTSVQKQLNKSVATEAAKKIMKHHIAEILCC
jgi:lipoate-protein ligase B